jgi:hypothetical protein
VAKVERDMSLVRWGSLGGALTFSSWRGIQYVKKKAIYRYRQTPQQQYNRDKFRRAVKAWQGLDITTQYLWRALVYGKGLSGYEYYVKKYMLDRV